MIRILILGDDEKGATTLRDMFELRGFNVLSANNIFSVMRIINSSVPDLIFMDANAPGVVCITFTTLIKTNPLTRKVPVIAFAREGAENRRAGFIQNGYDDFINLQSCEIEIPGILNKYKLIKDS